MYSRASEMFWFILSLFLFATPAFAGDETRYVQSVKADLLREPNAQAVKVGTMKRGDAVTVVETTGMWSKVRFGKANGWVSRIFLSANKPVGQADLQKEVPTSLEKASRRRPPSYSVNAAARGLAEDKNTGAGADGYKADYSALKKVEERKVKPDELEKFRDTAKLPK